MEPARRLQIRIDDSGPRPVIAGTDIKVSQVALEYEQLAMTPDDIVDAHPHLGLSAVHVALAYYYDHLETIRREWQEANALVAALRARYPSRVAQRDPNDE